MNLNWLAPPHLGVNQVFPWGTKVFSHLTLPVRGKRESLLVLAFLNTGHCQSINKRFFLWSSDGRRDESNAGAGDGWQRPGGASHRACGEAGKRRERGGGVVLPQLKRCRPDVSPSHEHGS